MGVIGSRIFFHKLLTFFSHEPLGLWKIARVRNEARKNVCSFCQRWKKSKWAMMRPRELFSRSIDGRTDTRADRLFVTVPRLLPMGASGTIHGHGGYGQGDGAGQCIKPLSCDHRKGFSLRSWVIFLEMRRRHGTVRYGTVRYGTVRYGTVRYGTVRYGTV